MDLESIEKEIQNLKISKGSQSLDISTKIIKENVNIFAEVLWKSTNSSIDPTWHGLFGAFVLEQQWCLNLVSIFTNRSRVHEIIENYESTQASQLMTS